MDFLVQLLLLRQQHLIHNPKPYMAIWKRPVEKAERLTYGQAEPTRVSRTQRPAQRINDSSKRDDTLVPSR